MLQTGEAAGKHGSFRAGPARIIFEAHPPSIAFPSPDVCTIEQGKDCLTKADQIGTWVVPQSPFAIEYSVATLQEINLAALDALAALRGGLGIGGVLLGTHDPKLLKIHAFRAVECEYAFGPVFVLSDRDRRKLTLLLRDLRQDPELRGAEVVGWYVSHTRRGGRMLAESDLEIYRTFFPEPWQVALLLQPGFMAPTAAGFFFREEDGSVHSSSTYREFSLGTWQESAGRREAATRDEAPDQPGGRPVAVWTKEFPTETRMSGNSVLRLRPISHAAPAQPEEFEMAARPEAVEPPKSGLPLAPPDLPDVPPLAIRTQPAAFEPGPVPDVADLPPISRAAELDLPEEPPAQNAETDGPAGSAQPAPASMPPLPDLSVTALPSTQDVPPERVSGSLARSLWLWLAAVVVVAAAAGWTLRLWLPWRGLTPAALHLKAAERNGLLEIRWDSAALASQTVRGGAITITDGTATESFTLDRAQVMSGSVLYPRRSNSVDVHMTVKAATGATTEGYITFAAAEPKTDEAASSDQQDEKKLATEAERAQQELSQMQERNQQLEKALKMAQAQPGPTSSAPPNRTAPARAGTPLIPGPATAQIARPAAAKGIGAAPGNSPQPTVPSAKPPEKTPATQPGAGRPAAPEPARAGPVTSAAAPPQVPKPQVPALPASQGPAPQSWQSAREGLTFDDVLKVAKPQAGAPPTPPPPAPVQRAAPQPPLLAGRWAHTTSFPSGSPFPPESVSLAIAQGNGQVSGTLSGRYRVPKGRKFKPDVQLRFAGPAHTGSQKFTFTGTDGSTGEIEILPVAGKPNEIEVVWHAAREGLTFDEVLFRAQ